MSQQDERYPTPAAMKEYHRRLTAVRELRAAGKDYASEGSALTRFMAENGFGGDGAGVADVADDTDAATPPADAEIVQLAMLMAAADGDAATLAELEPTAPPAR